MFYNRILWFLTPSSSVTEFGRVFYRNTWTSQNSTFSPSSSFLLLILESFYCISRPKEWQNEQIELPTHPAKTVIKYKYQAYNKNDKRHKIRKLLFNKFAKALFSSLFKNSLHYIYSKAKRKLNCCRRLIIKNKIF